MCRYASGVASALELAVFQPQLTVTEKTNVAWSPTLLSVLRLSVPPATATSVSVWATVFGPGRKFCSLLYDICRSAQILVKRVFGEYLLVLVGRVE